ncbi:efflux RND transporter periplasmic adaptor subunit [Microbacterium sp. H1-D42]|uniref:efflux RND transporter periplasmic adaptor subunit n=1 Tax=Microbacterium sp. H1-D42 TaxID=2925844 RepID=UPI001F532B15|nr:efflux RND transporter periplasmic adaptor subunit [Microbacterium sp. H1-D42]UNK69702.1 efflux RND transporter periplasmic adaptor subunit [Microbacterium sp. H1-D42]
MLVWRRIVVPVIFILVLAAGAAALVKLAFFPAAADVAQEQPTAGIADPVIAVERGAVVNELTLQGNIARDAAYIVRTETDGTVTAVHVADGAAVAKDQLLFTIKQEYPAKTIEVRAPEAGNVSLIGLVKGQMASIGGEALTLTPTRHHLQATVQATQLYRLVNAPAEGTVTITGGPAPFTCTGVRVEIAEDGTASVRCAIPADQKVFAGLPATIDLALGKVDDALIVPVTAVKGGAGSGIVWVDAGDGSDPEERKITLGVNDGENVEVVEGLVEGDAIRQFVPGFAAPAEEFCYDDGTGNEICETGASW